MFEKTFAVDGHLAHTLNADEVCEGAPNAECGNAGFHSRTHADGWTISGVVCEDWVSWVNDFEAHHPVYGRVWGNFEDKVFADSEEGYRAFYHSHTPESWDYWDI